ncbi:MAG: phosphorylase [Fibrobacteres bacterium]|nr:phosphorylase [Fibrobacterota bacterium]
MAEVAATLTETAPSGHFPIRGEIFSAEHLEEYAARLAEAHGKARPGRRGVPLLRQVDQNGAALRAVYNSISRMVRADRSITPAAEWLADNFHVVDEQLREIRNHLPPSYYRDLPKLASGPFARYPRVYAMVCGYIEHTDSRLEAALLSRYIRAYQRGTELTIGELWAVAITLRVALIENLRRMADMVVGGREARLRADRVADALLGLRGQDGTAPEAKPGDWEDFAESPYFSAFAVQLFQRVQDQAPAQARPLEWLDGELARRGISAQEIIRQEHQAQAALNVSVRNIITSMRLVLELDWKAFFEDASSVEAILHASPLYSDLDFPSRDLYRHAIEDLARGSGRSETEVAQRAVRAAGERVPGATGEVGFVLFGEGRLAFEGDLGYRTGSREAFARILRAHGKWIYPGAVLAVTALFAWYGLESLSGSGLGWAPLLLLGILGSAPLSEGALALVNRFLISFLPPRILPKLDFGNGIPSACRTLVAVPAFLRDPEEIRDLLERLEVHYLANSDGDIRFALLTDWIDAASESMAGDEALLECAREGMADLNERYGALPDGGSRFLLLHRKRTWNEREGKWMGWERKRGKLKELNRILRGARDTTYLAPAGGEGAIPRDVKFVITLDMDTRLPKGGAARLAGCLAHPLNRPRFDARSGRVTGGYGILQPRVVPSLPEDRERTFFHWVTAGPCGIDPYAAAVSDVYQDLLGEGSYAGKGIYDVDAFEDALRDRIPDNTLLSHDLFEGIFARSGLLSDVEVLEEFPSHYGAFAAREHRWARGDWQLLPWILGLRGKGLPFLGRWKMLDNLRRSLVPPCAFLSLALGWIFAAQAPGAWTALVLVALCLPYLVSASEAAAPPRAGTAYARYLRDTGELLLQGLAHYLFNLVVLAHQAWLLGDAMLRSLWRMAIGRRSLLEWVTAAQAATQREKGLWGAYRNMLAAAILPVGLAAGLAALGRNESLRLAAPWIALWMASPALAMMAGAPKRSRADDMLTSGERLALRETALKTWRFFREFIRPEDHFLPPDNFQEDPKPVVAHRTSPTNMGLGLLSIATARDMGWIGLKEAAGRLEAMLASMGKLARYRGHFFNWYSTTDLRPLEPRYISTVDSGNLAGHLLTLARACREYMESEILAPSLEEGLADLIHLVRDAAQALPRDLRVQAFGKRHMIEALEALEGVLLPVPADAGEWSARVREWEALADTVVDVARTLALEQKEPGTIELQSRAELMRSSLEGLSGDVKALFPWAGSGLTLEALCDLPIPATHRLLHGRLTLAELEQGCLAAAAEVRQVPSLGSDTGASTPLAQGQAATFAAALVDAATAARSLMDRFAGLAAAAERLALGMDFRFLIDPQRKLFAIGFRVREEALDPSFYDLLASEARLTSFLAVAKGDAPPSHWFRLGRTLTPVGSGATLLSWSGSMFEYLMPQLVMRSPPGSLIDSACRSAVKRQIEYGRELGIPWGVSEAAYNIRDLEMTYQYSSFGVPGLGLKRGLSEDRVIAPYATGLAAMVAPRAAAANLESLRAAGAEGRYGFYEAIDYTQARLQEGERATVVRAYFAHHQGMMLVALGDVLLGGRMQERFHSLPIVRAVDPLLQERLPKGVTVSLPNAWEASYPARVEASIEPVLHRFTTPHELVPRTHLLSNGNYSVLMTVAGSGFSRWQALAVTRWREDAVLDDYGQYFYLRDGESGATWSAGYQPLASDPDLYEAVFAEDKIEIERRDESLITRMEVVISPEDDAEVRRITIENKGSRDREIEITSYCEIALAPQEADIAHPAFSNLFVQTEFLPALSALLATRRPRSASEKPIWAAHVCGVEGEVAGGLQYETDRARFLGRGRTVRDPVSVADGKPLSNTAGAVLDPVFSLRRRVRVPEGGQVRLVFATFISGTREHALALADKYREASTFERVATLAWTQAQVQLRHLGVGPDEARLYQRLANRLFYPDPALRPSPDLLALNHKGQDALWPYGISGDLPIIFAAFDEAGDRNLARDLLKAHAYFEMKRLDVDLVLLNENPSESYFQPQQNELEGLLRMRRGGGEGMRGGVFLLRRDRIPAEDRLLIQACSRVVLSARRGSLSDQVMRMRRVPVPAAPPHRRREASAQPVVPPPRPYLEFFNGLGGFTPDGKEYQIILGEGQWTPAPWINVIANPHFGFIASEAGSGYTWCGNSRERKLTPWSDDPVSDSPGEAMYVRDRESGEVWTPTALPVRLAGRPYVAVHGQGYTRYMHASQGIRLELTQWVPESDPVKISRLVLENVSPKTRQLDVTAYVEWVLAPVRGMATQHIVTRRDPATGALTARNAWIAEFAEPVAFADLQGRQSSFTCDRAEFLGRNGSRAQPLALQRVEPLSNRSGAGLDPCAALQVLIELPPGGKAQIVFTLGQADSDEAAAALIKKYRDIDHEKNLADTRQRWDSLLGGVQVKTPDRSLDLLLNRWLPYQVIACRLWARTAFYQAGGAFGFRDQLQDVMAMCVLAPEMAHEQILRASGRQFRAGDVQHWWHPPSGRGVRTHFSDDRLWLPYAVLHYLEATGDAAILEAQAPWLDGPEVPEGREDAYFQPTQSEDTDSLYEHCARALERSMGLGAHGLPLMGSGDWNDGMNRVGQDGKGESGWLAWFLIPNLKGFADLAEARGDERGRIWREHAERVRGAMETAGWDGDWYRRGYFDDGSPLGSSQSQECRIDSIAQSWAVLSGAADPARARQAMFSVEEYLVRQAEGLVLLFTPPFDKAPQDPGYIKGYLPGVRENGGQYTHAALWVVAAFAALGEGDKAAELLSLLNPVNHAATRAGVYRYKVEPYVAAADVYAVAPHVGRGGWTWYTGSAGWMYRVGLEWLLGFRVQGDRLRIVPCPPRDWRRYGMRYRRGGSIWDISVSNPEGDGRFMVACEIDGVKREPPFDAIDVPDDGKAHVVRIVLGKGNSERYMDSSSTRPATTLS